jgi:hypothetical protein
VRLLASIILLFAAPIAFAADGSPRGGLLQLSDGSSLHGNLNSIEQTNGLSWKHPSAKQPLELLLTNVSLIRFDKAQPNEHSFKPACRFHFKNGDEVIGNIVSITDNDLQIESWFGDNLHAQLDSVDVITFSSKGYNLLYEGPNGIDGWRIGRNPRSWEYRDGAFIANGADLLGRDFGLSGSSTLEFDLAWNGAFSLSITLYASVIDRFDYSTSAYLIYLGTGAISVQRVQAGAGAVMLGQTQIPEMFRRNKMHFEIRCNKEDATIALFADGKYVARWKDTSAGGFIAKGGGIVFFSQVEPKALKLSGIRVAEWDGKFEPEAMTNAPTDVDIIYLANRDKVTGDVIGLHEGKATISTKQTKLDVPISRVTQIRFAHGTNEVVTFSPGEVRASFPGGETLSFELDKWNGTQVSGKSRTFGQLSFDPRSIRQLQFNLNRSLTAQEAAPELELDFPELE